MKLAGVKNEPDVTKPDKTTVFSFPIRSPEGATTRAHLSAFDHLELWKTYQEYWCEHKPSITVSVKEREWPLVGGWVYENFESISGVSFLPYTDHSYRQAPYQEVTDREYFDLVEKMPQTIDWSLLSAFEDEDKTAGSQSYACSGDIGCEVVDLV